MTSDESDYSFWEHLPRDLFETSARFYLGTFGDAVETRVSWCLDAAKALLQHGHLGPALAVAATALEIMIRFMVVRPFVGAAFIADEWADLLFERVINSRRSAEDRDLLPALLRHVNVDLAAISLNAGTQLWPAILGVWKARNRFIHQGDPPESKTVELALECAQAFRSIVIGAVARALGFSLARTGKWAEIRHDFSEQRFEAADPSRI
jgi:hypothetical protein